MMVLAFFRSLGNDSDRISCRQNRIAPAMAVATYTQKDLYHKQASRAGVDAISFGLTAIISSYQLATTWCASTQKRGTSRFSMSSIL